MSRLILCKLPVLFSTVKLRLGQKFSQFIHRSKIEIFWVLVLGCTSKVFPFNKEGLEFLNIHLLGLLNFSQFLKKIKKIVFCFLLCLVSNFSQFTKEFRNWDFWSPIDFTFFVRLWGWPFRHSMFVEERGKPNLWLNCQFSRKRNAHI